MSETLTQIIYASQTPGTAAPIGGPYDIWELSAAGRLSRNGVLDSTSSGVIALYYFNHTVYRVSSSANSSGLNPGWWTWSGTAWASSTSDPVGESSSGFSVTAFGPIVFASQTVGSAAAAGTALDLFSINNSGQVVHNGTVDASTSQVFQLYYLNHTTYYKSILGNANGTPGWWRWNGTGWSIATSPVIGTYAIIVNTISNQTTGNTFTVNGTIINYVVTSPVTNIQETASTTNSLSISWATPVASAPTLQYMDNASGTWLALPGVPVVTATSFSFTHPAVATVTPNATVSIRDANATTVSGTSNVFAINSAVQVTLNSISLSPTTFLVGASPISVGTVTVSTTPANQFPGSNGSLQISGTNHASFSVATDEKTLQTAATTAGGTYSIGITATMPGAIGSPIGPTTFTLTGQNKVSSITLSPGSFIANSNTGTVVGTISATMNDGTAFSGTFALTGTGNNNSDFQIVNNQLQTAFSTLGIGSYPCEITATPTASFSLPLSQTITVTATAGSTAFRPTRPQGAIDGNYSNLVFFDDFTNSNTIPSITGSSFAGAGTYSTVSSGHLWYESYMTQFCNATAVINTTSTATGNFASTSGGVITLNCTNTLNNKNNGTNIASIPGGALSSYTQVPAAGHWRHCYIEGYFNLDPGLAPGTQSIQFGWPGFWSWTVETSNFGFPYSGDGTGYTECDFFEYGGGTDVKNQSFIRPALHPSGGFSGANQPISAANWFKMGMLWTPPTGSQTVGTFSWYVNDVKIGDSSGNPPTSPIETHTLFITMGTGYNWPFFCDWIAVWQ